MNYRRAWHAGGTYFFTLNLLKRRNNDLLIQSIDILRDVVKHVKQKHPFIIHGWVVLPDHLHCVIELPVGDADFATRLRLINLAFQKQYLKLNTVQMCDWHGVNAVYGNAAIGST